MLIGTMSPAYFLDIPPLKITAVKQAKSVSLQ